MRLSDVWMVVFIILGVLLVFIGYWLTAHALFPRMVERARDQYKTRPALMTLLGLVVLVPLVMLGIGLLQAAPHPVLKIIGLAIVAVPILLGLIGSAGLSAKIGGGLPSSVDDKQPWRGVLRGGIVLSLTFLLPVIGWFLIMPWTIISGVGVAVVAMFNRPKQTPPTTSPVTA